MQSTKTASITQAVSVPADEVRSLLSVAAKNFVGIVDGQDGVKVVSSDVVVREDGSAVVAIVYEQDDAVEAKADTLPEVAKAEVEQQAAVVPGLLIPSAAA